jgi:hypothetical protein
MARVDTGIYCELLVAIRGSRRNFTGKCFHRVVRLLQIRDSLLLYPKNAIFAKQTNNTSRDFFVRFEK